MDKMVIVLFKMIYNKSLLVFFLFCDIPPRGLGCEIPPFDDSDVPWLGVKIFTEVCQVCQHSNFVLNQRRNEGGYCALFLIILLRKNKILTKPSKT